MFLCIMCTLRNGLHCFNCCPWKTRFANNPEFKIFTWGTCFCTRRSAYCHYEPSYLFILRVGLITDTHAHYFVVYNSGRPVNKCFARNCIFGKYRPSFSPRLFKRSRIRSCDADNQHPWYGCVSAHSSVNFPQR